VLEDLADQLRYAPRPALLRQLEAVESVAADLEAAQNYPEDWIIFRITGYRPEIENPATIPGAALLADCSALAERLSHHAALSEEEIAGPVLTLRDLAKRWNLAPKTIQRRRREGLVARRVRDEGGHERLVFRLAVVERFEARRGRVRAAPPIDRTTPAFRARVARVAARGRRRFGWTLSEAAALIAERTDRSHETIRRILKRADEASEEPVFTDRGPITARERRFAHRAMSLGADVDALAARLGRSRHTVHRIVNERRGELLRRLALPAGPARADEADALNTEAARTGLTGVIDASAGDFVERARAQGPPDRAVERARAAALGAARSRAARLIRELPHASPRASELDEIETTLRHADLLLIALLEAQKRTILSALEARLGAALLEQPAPDVRRLHRLAMEAAASAAATFDPERGGRLAGAVALAVDRALARAPLPRPMTGSAAARRQSRHIPLDDWTASLPSALAGLRPDPRLIRHLDDLPQPLREVAILRYGLEGGSPETRVAVGARLEAAPRRVALLEREALREARRLARADGP